MLSKLKVGQKVILKTPIRGCNSGIVHDQTLYVVGFYVEVDGYVYMVSPGDIDWVSMNKELLKEAMGVTDV